MATAATASVSGTQGRAVEAVPAETGAPVGTVVTAATVSP
ncbi:hypothetical protein NJB18091_15130, partial [Mycobacterium marinum]